MGSRRSHRAWFVLSASVIALVGVAVLLTWRFLPVIAPELVMRIFPSGDMSERAVVRLLERACDQQQRFALSTDYQEKIHAAIGPGLARGLQHHRREVRAMVLRTALSGSYLRPYSSIIPREALVSALDGSDTEIRIDTLFVLRVGRYDPLSASQLLPLASAPDHAIREQVAHYVRKKKAVDTAVFLLADPDPVIRETAISGLHLREDPTRAEHMLPLLNDPESFVRVAATKALGELGDERALPVLIAHLKTPDPVVREALVQALGHIEDIRALPSVITALGDPAFAVRRAAANALGTIGDPRAITALAASSSQDPDRSVRCAAVSALEAIKDPATLDPLINATKDPDPVVRAMAEAAIGRRP